LNDNQEYTGGQLIYATNGEFWLPTRVVGGGTIHFNDIVHGVSILEKGVRYSLFFQSHTPPSPAKFGG
jgi:hypothetical protein